MATLTTDERVQRALQLHRQGYNCAQATVLAFDDLFDADPAFLAAATAPFGGGIGGMQGTCGVVSGMGIVNSLINWSRPADKPAIYAATRSMAADFASANGSMTCADLRRARISCADLITNGVRHLAQIIGNNAPDKAQ